MTDSPALLPNPPRNTEDRARALIEHQLDTLGKLAEVGLNLALAIEQQATTATGQDESPALGLEQASLAYTRVARAVRLTLLLQSKLIADLQALDRCVALKSFDRKNRIRRIIGRVIEAEQGDGITAGQLTRETRERLDQDDIYGDVMTRPASELIAEICRDLGLSPDWDDLAQEAWADEEIKSGAAGSPLAAWMAARAGAPPDAADPHQLGPRAASP